MNLWKKLFGHDDEQQQQQAPEPAAEPAAFAEPAPVAEPSTVAEPAMPEPVAGPPVAGEEPAEPAAEPVLQPVLDNAEDAGLALSDADLSLLSACGATLESVGVYPQPGVEIADFEDAVLDDLEVFRRRPLTTLLSLRDPNDGEMLCTHVYVDDDEITRTTPADLVEYLDEVATAAGSADYIDNVVVMPDSGDPAQGSLRFRNGQWDVHDVPFELDPDFGDLAAEQAIIPAVAQPGWVPYTFEAAYHANPVTVWVDSSKADALNFASAIEAELDR